GGVLGARPTRRGRATRRWGLCAGARGPPLGSARERAGGRRRGGPLHGGVRRRWAARGRGRGAVAGALASKGVSRETIDRTLAGLEQDESMRALEVATERARRPTSLRPRAGVRR